MTTLCECGHALSQHPDRGPCDYCGYNCQCQKYKRRPRQPSMKPKKQYKESTKVIVADALKFAEDKRAKGWTKQDAAASLKKMLESDAGKAPPFSQRRTTT